MLHHEAALSHQEVLDLRLSCVGGTKEAIQLANSALKTMRFVSTTMDEDGGCEGTVVDVSALWETPILPWQYQDEKGPNGQWSGEVVWWNWKDFVAKLNPVMYAEMFGEHDIVSFVARACPFRSPYPPTAKLPHWEFTATRADGVKVGIHPPGKSGKVVWTTATDEDRAAALAAVKNKGVSQKLRACYQTPPPIIAQPATHLGLAQPTTLQGGRIHAEAVLAAYDSGTPVPSNVPRYVELFLGMAGSGKQLLGMIQKQCTGSSKVVVEKGSMTGDFFVKHAALALLQKEL